MSNFRSGVALFPKLQIEHTLNSKQITNTKKQKLPCLIAEPISAEQLNELKKQVTRAMKKIEPLSDLQIIFQNKCLTATQARSILLALEMEANRLQFAKFIYHYISDRQNFDIVIETLTFEPNKAALIAHISMQ